MFILGAVALSIAVLYIAFDVAELIPWRHK